MSPIVAEQCQFQPLTAKDYKSGISPIWCPGCGHHSVINGVYKALADLEIDPTYLMTISGIGCSSRLPYFLKSYKMHTLHGRAGAVATGAQLARPELTTLVVGGDGDGFSIGGGHMPHMARKNVNLTYVLMDNRIYGLTKGQASPTSAQNTVAYTTPYGSVEAPLNPLLYMLTYGATYVAQGSATKPKSCADLIKGALDHKGFSYVNILSQCPTFNKVDTLGYFKSMVQNIPEDHDIHDLDSALVVANHQEETLPIGLLYQAERPALHEQMEQLVTRVDGTPDYDLRQVIDLSRP